MFRYEKDMIPVLKEKLSRKFNTNYFVEEFNTGIGIADLVFTKNISSNNSNLTDYETISYAVNYINPNFNKKINILETIIKNRLNKNKFLYLIDFLESSNSIIYINENTIKIVKKFKPSISEFYSIEAKLKDWKNGLYQALRYKNYSHVSYLAISEKYLKLVNIEMIKENNIGLISVSENKINIIVKPQKELPINQIAQFYLSSNFVQKIESDSLSTV